MYQSPVRAGISKSHHVAHLRLGGGPNLSSKNPAHSFRRIPGPALGYFFKALFRKPRSISLSLALSCSESFGKVYASRSTA